MIWDDLAKAVFLATTLLVIYHHFIYPLALRWLARRNQERPAGQPRHLAEEDLPSVTVIVPAYNEEAMIAGKVANLMELDYPRDRLRVLIVLDGCRDQTGEIARAALDAAGNPAFIELHDYPVNQGKLHILNTEIERAHTDLVVLSDVSANVKPDALRLGVAHFSDDDVGVVCATYALERPGSEGEAKYWSYQTELKAYEAAVAAPMGAHGAFYMFRRICWSEPLPPNTINDDFVLPMRIVAQGYRAVYDQSIVASEREQTNARQEFSRRIRIGAGNMQQLIWLSGLLDPRRARLAFVFGSGKALRVAVPFLALAGVVATLYLTAKGYELFLFIAMAGAIVSCLGVGAAIRRGKNMPNLIAWLGYLIEGYCASFIGAVAYLFSPRNISWSARAQAAAPNYVPLSTRIAKRVFDVTLSVAALLLLWPLFLPIMLAIRLESRGPVFYRQLRVGRAWPERTELFHLVKFRTMYEDAEKTSGPMWATKNDPRITKVGRFLRKTRLDELPQFINVLAGDMSLIGPRPERPKFIGGLEREIPFYTERTYGLRPGITGLAQVNQGYDESIEDVRNKLLYDHAYAAHLSSLANWFKMDVGILFSTVAVMITGRGQ